MIFSVPARNQQGLALISRGNHLFAGLWFGKGKPHVEGTLHFENKFNKNYLMLDFKTRFGIYLLKHIDLIVQGRKSGRIDRVVMQKDLFK